MTAPTPRDPKAPQEAAPPIAPHDAPVEGPRRPRVVVADPEPGPRLAARLALERAGFAVRAVTSAPALHTQLAILPARAAILVDLRLPGLDLARLAAALRAMTAAPSVLYLACANQIMPPELPPDVVVVTKPFSPSDLVARVMAMIA